MCFVVLKAALFNDPLGLAVPIEMTHQNKVQLFFLKEPPNDPLYRFRHQTPAPVVPGEHIADFPALVRCQFLVMGFVVLFDAQRADDFSLIFQGKDMIPPDKVVQDGSGFLQSVMGLPARHLSHTVHTGILVEVL